MKTFAKSLTAILICGALSFGVNFDKAEASEMSNAIGNIDNSLNSAETQDLRGWHNPPPPRRHNPPPRHYYPPGPNHHSPHHNDFRDPCGPPPPPPHYPSPRHR